MKPTVHDIAERAGVSLATIDRVLNMRPGVHAATRARVEAAIAELGYVRDIAAANLAKGRNYSMIFILPGNDNSFMATLRAEVRAAASRSHLERTAIRVIEVPPFNAAALTEALEVARREKPSGVAFVATDSEDVAEAADRLAEDGIATVTLVSDLSGSRRDHYAGVDNVAAGRTYPTPAELVEIPSLALRSRELRPVEPFVAVEYRGAWYWIDDRDYGSKRVFSILMLLLNLVDKGGEVQLPVITIPTG